MGEPKRLPTDGMEIVRVPTYAELLKIVFLAVLASVGIAIAIDFFCRDQHSMAAFSLTIVGFLISAIVAEILP